MHSPVVTFHTLKILILLKFSRIYNLSSLEIPEQAVSVGLIQPGVVLSACTGEAAVTFAFGQPKEALKSGSGNPVSNSIIDNLVSIMLEAVMIT